MGFESPYSWTKWLRISFAVVALFIALSFWSNFGGMVTQSGIIGLIFGGIIFLILFAPTIAVMLGIATLIGFLIGGAKSGVRQSQSLRESSESGDDELLSLDKLRLKVQIMNVLFVVFIIAVLAGGVVFLFNAADMGIEVGQITVFIVGAIMLVLIAVFWIAKAPMNRRYKEAFKEQVVVKGLESVLTNIDFRPSEKLDAAIVKGSQMFKYYNTYSGNDYLSAEYHGIRFTQSDVHLQEAEEETYTDDDGERHTRTKYTTIFHGTFMVFDYDAISNEPVLVLPRGGKPKDSEILTELDAFNRKFSIVCTDAASAFRILTPPVLEGIVLVSDKLGYQLSLSSRDDKIYAAIANGDSFEASARGDATLSEQRDRIAREIQTILDMIETLYLRKH
jgi:hypothetical protein